MFWHKKVITYILLISAMGLSATLQAQDSWLRTAWNLLWTPIFKRAEPESPYNALTLAERNRRILQAETELDNISKLRDIENRGKLQVTQDDVSTWENLKKKQDAFEYSRLRQELGFKRQKLAIEEKCLDQAKTLLEAQKKALADKKPLRSYYYFNQQYKALFEDEKCALERLQRQYDNQRFNPLLDLIQIQPNNPSSE